MSFVEDIPKILIDEILDKEIKSVEEDIEDFYSIER